MLRVETITMSRNRLNSASKYASIAAHVRRLVSAARLLDVQSPRLADTLDGVLLRIANWYGTDGEDEDDEDGTDEESRNAITEADEFWLDHGSATYANGNIGDDNHESLALQQMAYAAGLDNVTQMLGLRDGATWEDAEHNFSQMAESIADSQNTSRIGDPEDSPADQFSPEIAQYFKELYREHGEDWWSEVDLGVILEPYYVRDHSDGTPQGAKRAKDEFGNLISGMRDARQYAKKHMGWQAVRGKNIELHELNESSASHLAEGLEDAYHNPSGHSFNIEVEHPIKYMMYGVPFEDIRSGAVVNRYRMESAAVLRDKAIEEARWEASKKAAGENPSDQGFEAKWEPAFGGGKPQDSYDRAAPIVPTTAPTASRPPLYDAAQGAKNVRDQMRGIPGYVPPIYDQGQTDVPRKPDGTPVYKYVGGGARYRQTR